MCLLVVLLSCKNIVEFTQNMGNLDQYPPDEIIKKVDKMKNSSTNKSEKMFIELLYKCIVN
jgi:hypothetical protein